MSPERANPPRKLLWKALPLVFGLLSLMYMLHATEVYNKNTGLTHDALWDFAPAVALFKATPRVEIQEFKVFHYPIPLVSGPYSGALKIWILAPLLTLFGTSPRSDLILNVVFGFAYLIALYWALLPPLGRRWASLVFLLPLFDANYMLTVPLDNGIFLTQYIFISLTIGALLRFLSNPLLKYFWMAWFFSGCLLAQKLTAIPIVISFVVMLCILSSRCFLQTVRTESMKRAATRFLLIPAVLFLIPMIPQLCYFAKAGFERLFETTSEGRWHPYFRGLSDCLTFFTSMFDGADWYYRVTLDRMPNPQSTSVLSIAGFGAIAASFLIHIVTSGKNAYYRHLLVCTCVWVGSFLLYPAFRGLDRPWHYYVLAPTFFCCVMLSLAHVVGALANKSRQYSTVVFAVFGIFMACGCAAGAIRGVHILRRLEQAKGACVNSPALNETFAAIQASQIRVLYAVNYSLANPVYVFSKGSVRTKDLAWTDLTGNKIAELLEGVEKNPGAAIVYRFCEDKSLESRWIEWLNREPQIFDLMKRVELEGDKLSTARHRDKRHTEFVLIRNGMFGSAERRR